MWYLIVSIPDLCNLITLNKSVHEGLKDISNVKVHLKTRSGNVNINLLTLCMLVKFSCFFVFFRFFLNQQFPKIL